MTRGEREAQLRSIRFTEVRCLAWLHYGLVSYQETLGDRDNVYAAILDYEERQGFRGVPQPGSPAFSDTRYVVPESKPISPEPKKEVRPPSIEYRRLIEP